MSKFNIWIVTGLATVIIAGGGFISWTIQSKKDGKDKTHAFTQEDKETKEGYMVPIEPFIVSLSDSSGISHLEISVSLVVDNMKSSKEIESRMPQIRNSLLMLLTSKTSREVVDIQGKMELQDEILARVNMILNTGNVKSVYFNEFVIQ